MSALTVQHEPRGGDDWDELVRIREEANWPEGCKVEIIEGILTVAPQPSYEHNFIAAKTARRLNSVIPEDWEVYQTLGLALPARSGLYIPDLVVVQDGVERDPDGHVPAAAAELVVEITSRSNAKHDRVAKLAGYAQAGVPLYLLIDAFAALGPTITLHGQPRGDLYRVLRVGKFGETFHLPTPFDVELDTSAFPTP
ncbi:Uma2 family endonuclease [Streptomyces sp. NPDC051183]|uniref:Uma2 family endonuclease n=1 Tax=unclassified Streptomyces TaxID=2593676 RepID=UPI00342C1EF7